MLDITRPGLPYAATQDRARLDAVEFPVLLANHAPMVHTAMHRLGASPERIGEWYEHYRVVKQLQPIPPSVAPITEADWRDHLGDRTREADYRDFMLGEVARLGRAEAIRRYLPALIPGIGASATHPLMRIAYGLLANDDEEIGTAIGYWATTYLPLAFDPDQAPETADPLAVLARIGTIGGIHDYDEGFHLLWHHMRKVASLPDFPPIWGMLAIDETTLEKMAAVALNLYAATMDFAALHIVTGLHWCRILMPWLDDAEPLLRYYWQAIATLVPYVGFPTPLSAAEMAAMRALPAPSWDAIKRAAVASPDEHDISLTFSASEEEKIWGDPLYRVVAARRVGLLP